MKTYIFGYGSLMEKESRTRSASDTKEAYPVKVRGLMRGWFARTPVSGLTTTFLGCTPSKDEKDNVNGVVFEVTKQDIEDYDKREIGYSHLLLKVSDIKDYCNVLQPDDKVYVYVNSGFNNPGFLEENLPSQDCPIVQSYVDICVHGCIELQEKYADQLKDVDFAHDFIHQTKFWSKYWVNDRIYPRRPFIHRPTAYKIDELLKKHLVRPELFYGIYFE
jgi:hypothetical protein